MDAIKWFIMGFAWGTVVGFLTTFISIKFGLRRQRKEKQLFDRLNHRTYLHVCGYDEDECLEHHLPGDCPLCGAK